MTILKTLKQHFRRNKIDQQIISSFWSICHISKAWGLNKEGMLQRNNLLNQDQINQLSIWIDCISSAVLVLLDGIDDEHAFELYTLYLEKNNE